MRGWAAVAALGAVLPCPAVAQTKAAVDQERRGFTEWIDGAAVSPRRAVVVRPVGSAGLSVGPASADIPLAGVGPGQLAERDGRVTLTRAGTVTPLVRGRPLPLGEWRLVASGPAGRAVVTVFGAGPAKPKPLTHYPYASQRVYVVTLLPAAESRSQRLLAPDGVEVDATDAGTVTLPAAGGGTTLKVMRLPGATQDESELEIYFRDGTAGKGTYPAGRFVSLIPVSGDRYTLDFNRARNPFCAYNTVYPCPAPWRGNTIPVPIRAGERYAGGGLDAPFK